MKKVLLIISFLSLFFLLTACQTHNNSVKEEVVEQVAPQEQKRLMHMGRRHMQGSRNMDIPASTGENELNIPPLLESDRVEGDDIYYTVEAQKGETEIFPGIKTNTLGYNGNFLGPAIRLEEGQNAHFTLKNNLNEDTTFHWHGLIVGGNADGGPHDVIRPKEETEISFPVQQSAATLWFHPHPLGNTAKQVYEGLAGLLLIENETSADYVYGENDFPLIIQDKIFTEDKQLDYATAYHPNGTFGNTILINGTVNPKLTIPKEKVRLRLLNGSNSRAYTFSLSNGASFEQIASDGGLLNEAVEKH
ncbi:MAG TPA: multicopper oxidase domain-containing protein [Pseudogracilibacillus sp.]|nr:multicopper oxidase domain-containing protein [Pseudogracilibacillus sp.]